MRSLVLICVFSAFTATGFSLKCKVCMGQDTTSCLGTSETCPEENACGAVYERTKISGQMNELYTISCVPRKECNTPGSLSILQGKTLRGTSCCFTSDCTPSVPSLPADESEINGLVCGPCVVEGSNACTAEEIVECTGKENMCLFQTAVTTDSQSVEVFRGCSTQSYCRLTKHSMNQDKVNGELMYTCTPAKNHSDINLGNSGRSPTGSWSLLVLFSGLLPLLLCSKW